MTHSYQPQGGGLNFDLSMMPQPGVSGYGGANPFTPPGPFESGESASTNAANANILSDLSNLDVFAESDTEGDNSASDHTFPLSTELELSEIFDAVSVCTILKEKIKQPASSWTQKTPNGTIVFLHSPQEKTPANPSIPQYISLQVALELVSSFLLLELQETVQPNLENASQLQLPIEPQTPSLERLETFAWGMELLQTLQSFGTTRDVLLPSLPLTQHNIYYLSTKVIIETIVWFSNTVQDNKRESEKRGIECAIKACWNATEIFNRVLSKELSRFKTYGSRFEHAAAVTKQKVAFPFLWYSPLTSFINTQYYVALILKMTQNVLLEPFPQESATLQTGNVWACFSSLMTFFFHICFSVQFASNLTSNPETKPLFGAFEALLQKLQSEVSTFAYETKNLVFRILTVLCETAEPYFLDFFWEMEFSKGIALFVLHEASKMVELLPLAASEDTTQPKFVTVREAFRVMELFSYDTNYQSIVIDNATLFLLEILSVDSEIFVGYTRNHNAYQQDVCVLLFRVLASLHSYNPQLNAPSHKGKLVAHMLAHCETIYTVDEVSHQLIQTKQIVMQNLISNLYYLFQRVTNLFENTQQVFTIWVDLLTSVEDKWGIKFPYIQPMFQDTSPTTVPTYTPGRRGRPPNSARNLPPPETLQPEIEDEEMVIEGMGPRTKIFKGISASLGKVNDPNGLKLLIKYHGGNVLEYVSKSVTHVICSADQASVQASSSKIQSASSKQIPAVSDQFIYESVEARRLLPEKNFLTSAHSYQRRFRNLH